MNHSNLDKLSRLRGEEQSRKNAQEEEERIAVLGQESDLKAAKWIREDSDKREKEDLKFQSDSFVSLEAYRKQGKKYYNRFLRLLFKHFVEDEAIPEKYTIWTKADNEGLQVGIMGTNLYRAIKPVGIEKYDFLACKSLAVMVGNTVAHLEGHRRETEKGIVLPDSLDKKYGRASK